MHIPWKINDVDDARIKRYGYKEIWKRSYKLILREHLRARKYIGEGPLHPIALTIVLRRRRDLANVLAVREGYMPICFASFHSVKKG